MPPLLQAACWAFAAVAIALAGAFGLIPSAVANTLVIVLPIVMLTTVTARRRRCGGKVG
ncbi:MAG TPA: hypothetical protein PKD99_11480 [Sphingopyxis sp.]|nr:hypothetical protein [Sphingopyxis sp.]HMP45719.1 hypothetical protein [Sphingopyxis sp.]HMQ20276.1 hypothetical protein [Sphingopyxis sp.]